MALLSFGKKKTAAQAGSEKGKATSGGKIPDFAPGTIGQNAAQKYFEMGSHLRIERNRWFLIALILGGALVAESVSLSFLFPLKTVETIQVNKLEGGRLVADPTPVGSWVPDNDSLAYFINRWAESVFDVKRATIQKTVADSALYAIDTAAKQLTEFRQSDNPIASLNEYPGYSRSYTFMSINFLNAETALLRFKTTTRKADVVEEDVYLMTVVFTLVKPKNVDQVVRNPAGLYVTNFTLSKESSKATKVTAQKISSVVNDKKPEKK